MAIVLKYGSPGPLLQAGFAAGVGKRKKDQTDDLLSVWQQQTQQGFQANQAALARQQQVGLQLQHQNFQADQTTLENYRADRNRFQQQQFQVDQADKARLEGNLDDQKKFNRQRFFALKPIPDHADGETRKLLTKHRAALSELMGPQWDQMDPKVQQAFQEEHDAYTAGVTALEAHAPKAITHIDPRGHEFDQPAVDPETGLTTTQPYDKKTLKPIENPQAKATAEAQVKAHEETKKQQEETKKQQEKMAADAAKQAEKFQTANEKWLEKRHATALRIQKDNTDPKSVTKPPLDFAAAEKEMTAAGFAKPQPPAPIQQSPAATGAPNGQSTLPPGTFEPIPGAPPGPPQVEPIPNAPNTAPQIQPLQGQAVSGQFPYTPEAIQEDLKKYPELHPDVAKGVTPELVGQMAQNGAQDPVRAAVIYSSVHTPTTTAAPQAISAKTPGELGLYQREQAAKARAMGIAGSSTLEDPRATGEGSEYADQSGKKYKMINGTWKRIQ